MFDKLEGLVDRLDTVLQELNDPDVASNQNRFRDLMKEQNDLTPIVEKYKEYKAEKQNIEDSFPIPTRFLGSGRNFMLVVKGESMIEAGIMDGDYILVEQQNSVRNGDIVVAMVDGFESEATVKTFYKEADHIRLQPENSTMSPIIVKDVKILGKVKGVFRYF